jgi:hypothetical protein
MKGRAKDFMASDDALESLEQHVVIEFSFDHDCALRTIGQALIVLL